MAHPSDRLHKWHGCSKDFCPSCKEETRVFGECFHSSGLGHPGNQKLYTPTSCKVFDNERQQLSTSYDLYVSGDVEQSTAKRQSWKRPREVPVDRQTSAEDKPFICKVCGNGFGTKIGLRMHSQVFHTYRETSQATVKSKLDFRKCKKSSTGRRQTWHKVYTCEDCSVHFEEEDQFIQHHEIFHPKEEQETDGTCVPPAAEKESSEESQETMCLANCSIDGQKFQLFSNSEKLKRKSRSRPAEDSNALGGKTVAFLQSSDNCQNRDHLATHSLTAETCSAAKRTDSNQGSKKSRGRPTKKSCKVGNESRKRSRVKLRNKSGKAAYSNGENQTPLNKDMLSFFPNSRAPVGKSDMGSQVRPRAIPKIQSSDTACTSEDQNLFSCIACDEKFAWKDELAKHYQQFHTGAKIMTSVNMQSHKKSRSRPKKRLQNVYSNSRKRKVFACIMCSNRFASQSALVRHSKQCHVSREPSFESIKKPTVGCSKRKNKVSHKGKAENLLACPVCDEKFLNKAKLTTHCQVLHATNNVRTSENPGTHMKLRTRSESNSYMKYFPDDETDVACTVCNESSLDDVKLAHDRITFHSAGQMKASTSDDSGEFTLSMERIQHLSKLKIGKKQLKRDNCGKAYYECEVCFQRLTQASSLKSHLRKHTGERPYVCQVCNASFSFYQCLWNHSQKHTGEKRFQCQVCLKSFVYYQTLWGHERKMHANEKSYKCTVCGVGFLSLKVLKVHIKEHTGKKQYECEFCCKKFELQGRLLSHRAKHIDCNCYKCDICEKRCKRLKKTQQNHGAKFNQCSVKNLRNKSKNNQGCSMSVKKLSTKLSSLKKRSLRVLNKDSHHSSVTSKESSSLHSEHGVRTVAKRMAVVEEEKPYVCHICNKAYTSAGRLQTHTKQNCSDLLKKCNTCKKYFHNLQQLKQHSKVHVHKSPAKVNVSKRLLKNAQALGNRSNEVKPVKCLICDKQFKHASGLKIHSSKHSDFKPYRCRYCDRSYKLMPWLIRHCRLSHKVEEPDCSNLKCWECGTVFISEADIANHQRPVTCQACHKQFHCSYFFCLHRETCFSEQVFSEESLSDRENNSITAFRNRHVRTVVNESKKTKGEHESIANESKYCGDISENCADESESESYSRAGASAYNYFSNSMEKNNQDFSEVHVCVPSYDAGTGDGMAMEVDRFSVGTVYPSCSDIYFDVPVYGESLGYRNHVILPQGVVGENGNSHGQMAGYHNNNAYQCDVCSAYFYSETDFASHRLSHYVPGEQHHCIVCDQYFASVADLMIHAMSHIAIAGV